MLASATYRKPRESMDRASGYSPETVGEKVKVARMTPAVLSFVTYPTVLSDTYNTPAPSYTMPLGVVKLAIDTPPENGAYEDTAGEEVLPPRMTDGLDDELLSVGKEANAGPHTALVCTSS